MKPKQIMLIAGEASGDLLAADLVHALRHELMSADAAYTPDLQPLSTGLEPQFFGAGGPRMLEAGVKLAFDLTQHSVTGFSDVLKNYPRFRRLFRQLINLALERQPDAIIGVDFGAFNLRFASAIRQYIRSRQDWFHAWRPKIVQYVSPQVWASRPGRAIQMERDHDLVLSIFPFEKAWYAQRVPQLRVEFVGHPMMDRLHQAEGRRQKAEGPAASPILLLLPGSRAAEVRRHVPVLLAAWKQIQSTLSGAKALMILPDETLARQAKALGAELPLQTADLPSALARADLAIASTGTVTMECAFFGVPTVTIYRASWRDYQIAKHLITVKWLTMPNLLASEEVYPEFIQSAGTPGNIARAALDLLENEPRRAEIRTKLDRVIASLGGPGANHRAAGSVARLLTTNRHE